MDFIDRLVLNHLKKQMKNYILNLTKTKFAHGLFIAVGSAIATGVYNAVNEGHLPQSWADVKPILILGASAAVVYIGKNLGLGSGQVTPQTK